VRGADFAAFCRACAAASVARTAARLLFLARAFRSAWRAAFFANFLAALAARASFAPPPNFDFGAGAGRSIAGDNGARAAAGTGRGRSTSRRFASATTARGAVVTGRAGTGSVFTGSAFTGSVVATFATTGAVAGGFGAGGCVTGAFGTAGRGTAGGDTLGLIELGPRNADAGTGPHALMAAGGALGGGRDYGRGGDDGFALGRGADAGGGALFRSADASGKLTEGTGGRSTGASTVFEGAAPEERTGAGSSSHPSSMAASSGGGFDSVTWTRGDWIQKLPLGKSSFPSRPSFSLVRRNPWGRATTARRCVRPAADALARACHPAR
jgi:hypothetical protein